MREMQQFEGPRPVVHLRVEQVLVVRPAVRQAVHRLYAEQHCLGYCGRWYRLCRGKCDYVQIFLKLIIFFFDCL